MEHSNFVFFPGAISMSILLLTLMLPSETPLKPFSESYVDFALPIEVQSCDNAFYVPYIVFARNIFNLKGLGLFNLFLSCLWLGPGDGLS